jgi:hypothetical protein
MPISIVAQINSASRVIRFETPQAVRHCAAGWGRPKSSQLISLIYPGKLGYLAAVVVNWALIGGIMAIRTRRDPRRAYFNRLSSTPTGKLRPRVQTV